MQSGYPAAALLAFYLIHDRIVGGKAAERVFFHLDTYKSYPGIRRGRELSFGFRRNSQPVALGESHFLAVNNGFALAGNNAVYLFVALVRMDERNACARRKSARRLLLQRRLLKRNLRHTGNSVGAADNRPAQMEEKHAAEHRRRHRALYAACADGVQIIRCATDIFEDRLCPIHRTPRPPLQGGSFAYPRRRTRTRRKSRPGGLLPCGTG